MMGSVSRGSRRAPQMLVVLRRPLKRPTHGGAGGGAWRDATTMDSWKRLSTVSGA